MSKNDMVSVPREWAELLVEAGAGEAITRAELQVLRDALAQPAEQHQGVPAWYMTENGLSATHAKMKALSDRQGWDTSDYSVPLYTHADPGEVERLRTENERLKQTSVKEEVFDIVCKERDALRAQMAERDTLLTGAEKVIDQFMPNVGKCCGLDFALLNETLMGIRAALSASAEPGVKS